MVGYPKGMWSGSGGSRGLATADLGITEWRVSKFPMRRWGGKIPKAGSSLRSSQTKKQIPYGNDRQKGKGSQTKRQRQGLAVIAFLPSQLARRKWAAQDDGIEYGANFRLSALDVVAEVEDGLDAVAAAQ